MTLELKVEVLGIILGGMVIILGFWMVEVDIKLREIRKELNQVKLSGKTEVRLNQ